MEIWGKMPENGFVALYSLTNKMHTFVNLDLRFIDFYVLKAGTPYLKKTWMLLYWLGQNDTRWLTFRWDC